VLDILRDSFTAFLTDMQQSGAAPAHFQRILTAITEAYRLANPPESLSDDENTRDRVRRTSAGATHASAWLLALPDSPATTLTDHEYKTAVRLRLNIASPSQRKACACGHALDQSVADTHHFLLCNSVRNTSLFARHQRMVRCVQRLASAAGVTCALNVRDYNAVSDARQPDIELTGVNLRIISDISVTHPIQSRFLGAAGQPSIAAADMEERKARKYKDFARDGYVVIPFVSETYGACAEGVGDILRALATHAFDSFGTVPADFMQHAWAAVSVALQSGNTQALRNAINKATGNVSL